MLINSTRNKQMGHVKTLMNSLKSIAFLHSDSYLDHMTFSKTLQAYTVVKLFKTSIVGSSEQISSKNFKIFLVPYRAAIGLARFPTKSKTDIFLS